MGYLCGETLNSSIIMKGGDSMKKFAVGAVVTIISLFAAQSVMAQTATTSPSPTTAQTTTPTPTGVTVPTGAPATGHGGN